MTYFVLSKIAELIDTFFLVARKRNVIFLHWSVFVCVCVCCNTRGLQRK